MDALLEEAEKLRDLYGKSIEYCRYGYVKDEKYFDYGGRICFQDLKQRHRGDEYKNWRYFVAHVTGNSQLLSQDQRAYAKWWIEESCCSNAFEGQDPDLVIEKGAIFDCQKWPANHIIMACAGLRLPLQEAYEGGFFSRFQAFAKHTTNEWAMVIAQFTYGTPNNMVINKLPDGHYIIGALTGKDGIKRIIEHDYSLHEQLPTMYENTNFISMSKGFHGREGTVSNNPAGRHKVEFPEGNLIERTDVFGKTYAVTAFKADKQFTDEFIALNYGEVK